MSAQPMPDLPPRFRFVSELGPRPLCWLWPARLALGKLAVLEGDPGLGKSFVALDLCARLSSGRPWPDGGPAPEPATCVYLNGEDGDEDTLRPRLIALGADIGRVLVLDRDDEDLGAPLCLPGQSDALEAVVAEIRARLLVIDPITPFLGASVNLNSDPSVRRALGPLAALARRQDCAVLLVRHLNKRGGGRAVYRGLGSIGLVGACRSAWLVADEPGSPGRRVLAQVKNNVAAPQPSLAFEAVSREAGGTALNWLGPVAWTAEDLLAAARPRGRPAQARASAAAFLIEILADGPLPVQEVWDRARQAGLFAGTVRRAKKEVGVLSRRRTVDGVSVVYWLLSDQQMPPEAPPQTPQEEWQRWLQGRNQQRPPPTPLDD